MSLISDLAIVSKHATIGKNAQINAFSIVHDNVVLGENARVESYCELGIPTPLGSGAPLVIGDNCLIRSHSIFYESSTFGANLTTGHHVVARENILAGCSFQIGSYSELQGDSSIGDYVRFQSNIFVGKMTKIGNFVWVFPYVIFTNDPTPPSNTLVGSNIGNFAAIGAGSIILPGVSVGQNSFLAASSCLTRDLPDGMFAMGSPAKIKGRASEIKLPNSSGESAYPWINHFNRGYPAEVLEFWKRKNRGFE
jgi:acetyltransferase-like isoleucine patch superfamily enzyme